MIALALGSSVYLWNSETQTLVGRLETNPLADRPHRETLSISCLCWSKDGRVLGVGNRRGEIEVTSLKLWEVGNHFTNTVVVSVRGSVTPLWISTVTVCGVSKFLFDVVVGRRPQAEHEICAITSHCVGSAFLEAAVTQQVCVSAAGFQQSFLGPWLTEQWLYKTKNRERNCSTIF